MYGVDTCLECLDYWDGDGWDALVSSVEFSYNSSVCRATGFAPFEIVYGQLPRTAIDGRWRWKKSDRPRGLSEDDYRKFVKELNRIKAIVAVSVKNNGVAYDQRRKRQHDQNVRRRKLKIGARVERDEVVGMEK